MNGLKSGYVAIDQRQRDLCEDVEVFRRTDIRIHQVHRRPFEQGEVALDHEPDEFLERHLRFPVEFGLGRVANLQVHRS